MSNDTGAQEIARRAVRDIHGLLNEISLGILLDGEQEIQVQLKVTRNQEEFLIEY